MSFHQKLNVRFYHSLKWYWGKKSTKTKIRKSRQQLVTERDKRKAQKLQFVLETSKYKGNEKIRRYRERTIYSDLTFRTMRKLEPSVVWSFV